MNEKSKFREKQFRIITYIFLFFLLWSIYEIVIASYLIESLSKNIFAFINFSVKFAIWIIPVVFYLMFVDQVNIFSHLKLNKNIKIGIKGALIVSIIFLVYNILEIILMGDIKVDLNLSLSDWLNTVIMAGFAEELVFRGFILRKLWDIMTFKAALIFSSFLFLLIHYPIWFVRGNLTFPNLIFSSLYVFIIGIIMAYLYKKTDSLWSCIISHSLHNFIITILVLV